MSVDGTFAPWRAAVKDTLMLTTIVFQKKA